jgi:CBS domain containing-hemolysin-like protein
MNDSLPALHVAELGAYVWQLGAVVVCLLLLAFSSLSEAALVRMELGRARQLAAAGNRRAQRLIRLMESRQEVLTTLILLINLCIIVAAAYTTEITIGLTGEDSGRWVRIATIGMIAFILVFCEVTPKTYAVRRTEATALATAPIVLLVHRFLAPVRRTLHAIGIWIIRRLVVPLIGGQALATYPAYSDEEMIELMAEGEANGSIEEREREMIAGVIEFADKVTREVMTPRTDMICVSAETSLVEATRTGEQTGFSRLPVCEGDVDHIVGILYAKDMLSALQTGGHDLTAGQIARKPAPVIPESKKVGEVLQLMQRNRLHQAVVIDEYGGTAGLVTIEDLLEEIFGEIRDEHDVEAEPIRPIDDRVAVVDARVSVDEVEDHFGVELPEGEFDSLGGFVLDQLGRLPAAGERLRWRNLHFTVEAVVENRIQRLRVVRDPKTAGDEEEGDEGR